jgi:hypothetical protein
MTEVGKITINATEEERLNNEMENEIQDQKEHLKKYTKNITSLLGKKRSKEVKKAMISYLVENL